MRILLSCGETSGDLYAGELVRELRLRQPGIEVFGLGGDRLAAQGAELLAHVKDLAVVGLLEVVSHLRSLRRVFDRVLSEVDRQLPDVAVLVDYPDFNLRLARHLRRRGVRVVYYVSPQVWAWRRGRLDTIRKTVDHMLVIFPFEEALYREAGVPVTFVGHPLVDLVHPPADKRGFVTGLGLDPERPVVALLPGSRPKEIAHNLPPLAGAVEKLAGERPELQFLLALAPSLSFRAVADAFRSLPVHIVANQTQGVLASGTVSVVASGTATVEAALLGAPMVVVYRLAPLTYLLGRRLVKVPHFAMANLIAGERVVPEVIQRELTPERVAAEVRALLDAPARREAMQAGLAEVRRKLGEPGASGRAAAVVLGAAQRL
ncbi:MAG: lipid-A-disaccharide synthase [Acidobacteria bacterium]|nr:MAG: lipid-A-disaccharide synthase [Acidobacteriota bacterium]